MKRVALGVTLLAGAVALGAACGGNGNTGAPSTGGGSSSGGSGGLSGSSGGSGDTSGSSGSSSGSSGLNGSDDASVTGSDDGPNAADGGVDHGDSGGSNVLDASAGDSAGATPDGGPGGNSGSADAGHDSGSSAAPDAGHGGADAGGNSGGADAGGNSGGTDAGHGGADAGHDAGGDAGSNDNGSTPTMIPAPTATCPTIPNTGSGSSVLTYAGHSITVWAGAAPATPGPLVIYWYATGGTPAQAVQALGGQTGINKITSLGGVVVAPNTSTATGSNTGDDVWYTGDVAQVDEVVACAVQQKRVDPRHIHVLGYSAGALQTVYMWFARSGYVASVLSYSGGDVTIDKTTMQDPTNIPPAVVAHGAMGMDTFGVGALSVDFYNASHTWETDIKNANGFDIDCNDGSTHIDETTRFKIAPEGVQFFLDHPFKASPDPYASGLSSAWPSYCTIANN